MRVALFGGSFDPVHNGHIEPILEVRAAMGLDRVIYLPTARPPHKAERRFAPAHSRYVMVEMALLPHPFLIASAHELTMNRPAYTIETVEYFHQQMPDVDLHLIIGADSYVELDQWRRWREILEAVTLVVLARPGFEAVQASALGDSDELGSTSLQRIRWFENRPVEVSSTEIRAFLSRGERPPSEMMSPLVVDYCLKYSLYR